MLPNRIVSYALVVLGFVAAIAPVAANLDWTSTVGVVGGVGTIAAAGVTWLLGWQRYEERTDLETLPGLPGVPVTEDPAPDVGD